MSRVYDFLNPVLWEEGDLDRDRRAAINRFVVSFLESGSDAYRSYFEELYPLVERLFRHTDDLMGLVDTIEELSEDELAALRFTAAPHLSEDNLKTIKNALVDGLGITVSDAYTEIFGSLIDPIRFGWLSENRAPSDSEKREALRWTTSLWAIQKAQTSGRNQLSHRQERAVKAILSSCGYVQSEDTKPIIYPR